MALLTEGMVEEAVKLALPTIRAILKEYTWGPKGVVIAVQYKGGLCAPYMYVMQELDAGHVWEGRSVGDFQYIAHKKLCVSWRQGLPSQRILTGAPWALEEGDSLYGGAVAEDDSLAVAVSGSYEEVDEAIAWIVWNIIWMLCARRIAELRKAGIYNCP